MRGSRGSVLILALAAIFPAFESRGWIADVGTFASRITALSAGSVMVTSAYPDADRTIVLLDGLTGVAGASFEVPPLLGVDRAGDLVCNDAQALAKFAGTSGALLWRVPLMLSPRLTRFDERGDIWILGTVSPSGQVVARYSGSSGELLSTTPLTGEVSWFLPSSADEFVVVFGSTITRLSTSGDVRWRRTLSAQISRVDGSADELLVWGNSGAVRAVWKFTSQVGGGVSVWTVLADSDAFAKDAAGNIFLSYPAERQTRIVKLDAATGIELWSTQIARVSNRFAVGADGDLLIAGSTRCGELGVIKLRGANGERLWSDLIDDGLTGSPFLVSMVVDPRGDLLLAGRLMGDRMRVVKLAGETGELFAPDPALPQLPQECDELLVETRHELDQCLLQPPLLDADSDGEADASDACPDTPSAAAVDEAGCSLDQFCHSVELAGSRRLALCLHADWQNDEPLTLPRDCRIARANPGPGLRCIAHP